MTLPVEECCSKGEAVGGYTDHSSPPSAAHIFEKSKIGSTERKSKRERERE